MENRRPPSRFRLGTLMLLVIIAGLLSYIVADRWRRQMEARRREAAVLRAMAEAEQMRARAVLLQMQAMEGRAGRGNAGEATKGE
jgi:type II secretory pathway pseudopilin PulG